uniref:Uncharacterized protein n=1 Tax=Dicentrarchus labrax TaxID=13489 RepID=A0A8C4EHD0_DICLA
LQSAASLSCCECLSRHGLPRMLSGINCSEKCFEMHSVRIISLSFCRFLFFHRHHIICAGICKLDFRVSLTPLKGKQTCTVAGEEWLEAIRRRLNKQKKQHRNKKHLPSDCS